MIVSPSLTVREESSSEYFALVSAESTSALILSSEYSISALLMTMDSNLRSLTELRSAPSIKPSSVRPAPNALLGETVVADCQIPITIAPMKTAAMARPTIVSIILPNAFFFLEALTSAFLASRFALLLLIVSVEPLSTFSSSSLTSSSGSMISLTSSLIGISSVTYAPLSRPACLLCKPRTFISILSFLLLVNHLKYEILVINYHCSAFL